MLTFEQAKKIVIDRLEAEKLSLPNDSLMIIDELTIEKPYAWIFTYTSKLWHETKDDKYIIAGNAPIIVDKQSGNQTTYSTAYNIENIIEKYEEEQKLWSLVLVDNSLLDNEKALILKNKMNLSYDKIMQLKKGETTCIDSGSQLRLNSIQVDLLKIGVKTKLVFSWDDK
ncbi:MAG: hypothetical protein HYZ42_16350 [Bacteroidetes bacterium]|nr:hypothetical protein [Bacteroidota bacterium]